MAQTGTLSATVTAHFSSTDYDELRSDVKRFLKLSRRLNQGLARLEEHIAFSSGTALNG